MYQEHHPAQDYTGDDLHSQPYVDTGIFLGEHQSPMRLTRLPGDVSGISSHRSRVLSEVVIHWDTSLGYALSARTQVATSHRVALLPKSVHRVESQNVSCSGFNDRASVRSV